RASAAARRTAIRSSRRGRSTDSLASPTRATTRSTTSSRHWSRAASTTARWPSVSGLNEPGNAPLRVRPATDAPPVIAVLHHDERARREPDEGAVGIAADQQANETLHVREVSDEHHILALGLESGRPLHRIVVRCQVVRLLGGNAGELGPNLGGLPGPSLLGVEDPSRPDVEVAHGARCNAADTVNAGVGQPPLRVDLGALRLTVPNQIRPHGTKLRSGA